MIARIVSNLTGAHARIFAAVQPEIETVLHQEGWHPNLLYMQQLRIAASVARHLAPDFRMLCKSGVWEIRASPESRTIFRGRLDEVFWKIILATAWTNNPGSIPQELRGRA